MPNTLIPIQTYTLSATTASVTFSNIPQNYTDLKIVASARTARADNGDYVLLSFNGAEANSAKGLWGYGTTVVSDSTTNNGLIVPGNTAMASTFGNLEVHCPNYTSSTNKSISIDASAEDNASASNGNKISVFLWSSGSASTSAVTSITLAGRFASFLSGSTFTLYGISNGVKAVGGTLTVAGGYAYHTFTSTGSFLPNQKIKGAEILCVAGGGGGGFDTGGGGGGGGVLYAASQTLNAGTSYTALVGSGGAGGTSSAGTNGGVSVLLTTSPLGGGGGGGITLNGVSGGSGGGAAGAGAGSSGGTGTAGQGNNGGLNAGSQKGGAGGGGAGAIGQDGQSTYNGGAGGIGTSTYTTWHSITGTGVLSSGLYYIAAGGGGGSGDSSRTGGSGGIGGGGRGADSSNANIASGTANTGGGGGGGCGNGTPRTGAAGGSGLVIVRYPLS
jgi:hypothetical protein